MSDKSRIEWCDATWNIATGCTKVSAGCKHCYAERQWTRLSANPGTAYYSRIFSDVQCHPGMLTQPLRWKKPRRIFVCAMGDLFHPRVPFEFIDKAFAVMALAKQHTFIILTKRPERMREYCKSMWQLRVDPYLRKYGRIPDGRGTILETVNGGKLASVHLGVSVEDQKTADERIPLLLETPAAVRIVSAEPLLGSIDLSDHLGMWWNQTMQCYESTGMYINRPINGKGRIDQVIAGGESGPNARPSHPEWFRTLRDQCAVAGVAFCLKQNGEFLPADHPDCPSGPPSSRWFWLDQQRESIPWTPGSDGGKLFCRVGKRLAGRLLDGVLHDEYPEVRS